MAFSRYSKAVAVVSLSLLILWLANYMFEASFGEWSLSVAVGVTMLLMWPLMFYFLRKNTIAGFLFKINSKRGLKLMNCLGQKYSRFWIFIGNFALVLLAGGLGAWFVCSHLTKKYRRILLSSLAFFTVYVYGSQTVLTFIPFQIFFRFSPFALLFAAVVSLTIFKFLPVGHKRDSYLAFLLGFLFFAAPFLMVAATGEALSLAAAFIIGVVGIPGYFIFGFFSTGLNFALGLTDISAVYPSLPAVENGMPVLKAPGISGFTLPIIPDLLLAIVVLLVVHEGFHGLLARAQNIKLKFTGIFTASVLPLGAFVEPDEEQYKKESEINQARVSVVGSFSNICILALISFLLMSLIFSIGLVYPDGVEAEALPENASAAGFMEPGDILLAVDGHPINSLSDFQDAMKETLPNQTVSVITDKGMFTTELGSHPEHPERGFLGVVVVQDRTISYFSVDLITTHLSGGVWLFIFNLLKWMFMLNLLVGVLNLLPIPLLDGFSVYDCIFRSMQRGSMFAKKHGLRERFMNALLFFIFYTLALSIFPYFLPPEERGLMMFLGITLFFLVAFIASSSKSRLFSKKKRV